MNEVKSEGEISEEAELNVCECLSMCNCGSFCLYFYSANVDTFTTSSPNKYELSLSEQSTPQKSLITPKGSLYKEEQK